MNDPIDNESQETSARLLPGDHPQRLALHNEVHARPPEELRAPLRLSYLAFYCGPEEHSRQWSQIVALCRQFGVAEPSSQGNHFSADFGSFRLKWERHSEYARYKFIVPSVGPGLFDQSALDAAPHDFVAAIPGQVLVAAQVVIVPPDHEVFADESGVSECFARNPIIGADVASSAGTAWTDFRIYDDGYSRWLLRDNGMTQRQCGRIVQRLLEIDTYRMLALLALPLANDLKPELDQYDAELKQITQALASPVENEESALLERLTKLQVRIENGASKSAYRFSAARAYYDIVKRRVAELREERLAGLQTFTEFVDRRLAPAMNTCISIAQRQASLLERVSRSTSLLSTRVDIIREEQTQALLESMNRRAEMQLRLQQTVEGLSIAAITYYVVGLVGYASKTLAVAGVPLNPELVTGFSIPVVVVVVAAGVHRVRRTVSKKL
jgi:uncharacterized membrane-anchored protein